MTPMEIWMNRFRTPKFKKTSAAAPAKKLERSVRRTVHAMIEKLEDRQMLSADPGITNQAISPAAVGVNLNVNDFYRTSALWVNTANTLSAWAKFNDPATPNPNLTLTAAGYPKQSASTWTQLKGYPDGIYKLSYTGQATISISSMGQIIGTPVTVNNVTTADVQITHANGSNLIIGVSGLDPTGANPFGNLKLIMPGYLVDTTQMYNAATVQRLSAFGTIRTMDMQYANINATANWSDRTLPTSFLQTGPDGVAYEDLITLANVTHDDLWLNIPVNATDDYVDNLAKLLRDTLDPGLKVHIEYSNELWHNGFYSGQTNYANAAANPLLTSSYGNGRAGQQEAFKLKDFHDIFVHEFDPLGNNPAAEARFGFVFAGHPDVNDRFNTEAFSYIQQTYGSASFLEAYSRAMYINLTDAQDIDGMSMDQLFTSLESDLPGLSTEILASRSFATQYGLKFYVYEGGQHLNAGNFKNQNLKIAAQSDPRMGILYQRLLDLAAKDGVDLFMHYGYTDLSTQYGSWGLLESADTAGSVKWDQVLNNTLKRGDANLDHVVDYTDFTILRDSYLQTQQQGYVDKDQFWQQGDFNQDRRVTAADFYIWKAKATNLTSQQASDVAAFEATLPNNVSTKPVVTIVATDATASEPVSGQPADTGLITATRTGDTSQSLTVNLTFILNGTATYGIDYLTSTGTTTLTFAAGASTAALVITALADNILEPTETASVMLYARSGYTLGTSTIANVTIADVTDPGTPLKLSGTVIGTAGSYQNNGNTRDKAFDANTVTTYDGSGPDGNWVGLDLGTLKTITSIRYFPRINWTTRMNGGKFQASNSINFTATGSTNGVANVVTDLTPLLTGTVAGWNSIAVNVPAGYQYLRYLSPNGSYGDVAELEFYGVTPVDTTPPTVPGTPALVSKTDTSITINWAASTDNVGVTKYEVYRGVTTNGTTTYSFAGSLIVTSYTDSNLNIASPYTYIVKAYDAANNVSTSLASAVITTNDSIPPVKPAAPTLVGKTDTTISISWTATTDNVGVTRYDVYRGTTLITTVPTGGSLAYTDINLSSSTTYAYTVVAFDAAGNSSTSDALSITTNVTPDTTPPVKPLAPTLVSNTNTTASIAWTATTDNVGVTRYDLYRDTTLITSVATGGSLSYNDSGLTASTTYAYTVKAFDAAGNSSTSDALSVTTSAAPDVTPPVKPLPPTLVSKTDTTASVSWTATTDNIGVTQYKLFRGTTLIATVATGGALTFTDTNLTSATTYSYTVQAFDAAGNFSTSDALSVMTNDVTPPLKPLPPTLVSKTDTTVSVTWTATTDNVGVTQYRLFRGTTLVTTVATGGSLSYTDTNLTSATTYSYTVQAFDAAGNSNISDALSVTTNDVIPPVKPASPTLVSKTDITASVSWTATTDNVGVTQYKLFRGTTLITTVATGSTLSYTDSGLSASTTYAYTVQAFDAAGNSSTSDALSVTTYASPDVMPPVKPAAPALVSKTDVTASITWTATTDNIGVTQYKLFRGTTLLTTVATGGTLAYSDSGLTASTTYAYTVQAFDAVGNSSTSDPLSVTTNAGSGPAQLIGTVIGTTGSYNNSGNTRDKAFDGDTSTFFDGPTANGNWVGLDLGSAKQITKISYTPRPPRVLNAVTTTWGSRMVGGKFQFSNNANFATTGTTNGVANVVVDLYTITSAPTGTVEVAINNPAAYQFVRYLSPDGSYGDVGEIDFTGMAPAPDTTPPTVAGTPALVSKTNSSITINWAGSTDAVGVSKYEVYRGVTVSGVTTYTLAGTTTPATLTFTDTNLSANSPYTYLVKAYDAAGNFSTSLTSAVITTSPASAKLGGTVIGTTGSYGGSLVNTRDKAFDGDVNTFFDGPTANGNWVGLDLGSAKTIASISFAPRPPRVLNGVTTTWGNRMVGGYFQVSNNASFLTTGTTNGVANVASTIYTITTAPTGTVTVNVTVPAAYQYVRYVGPDGSYGDVGEIAINGY